MHFIKKMSRSFGLIAMISLAVTFSVPVQADPTHSPEIVSAEQTAVMMMQEDVVLIDNRPPEMFKAGHLPNAISMTYFEPGSAQNRMKKDMLDPHKGKKIIFYCSGTNRAYHAALKAMEWDISAHIFWFKGGWNEWKNYHPKGKANTERVLE